MSILVGLMIVVLIILIISFLLAISVVLLRIAIPILLIWGIYVLVRRHRNPDARQRPTYRAPRNPQNRVRKEARNAREVHSDDDNWSDF